MKIITAEKYRHFIPIAPALTFNIPSLSADGSNTLLYEYLIRETSEVTRKELPSAFWAMPIDSIQVYIDSILQRQELKVVHSNFYSTWLENEVGYTKDSRYLYTVQKYLSSHQAGAPILALVDSVTPMSVGMTVLLRATDSFDGWYHLDISRLLIQGANPVDLEVLATQAMFQGGYRLDFEVLDTVKYGELRRCDYHLGWDYKPPAGYRGIDSFVYQLLTEFGQKSAQACCSIRVGY